MRLAPSTAPGGGDPLQQGERLPRLQRRPARGVIPCMGGRPAEAESVQLARDREVDRPDEFRRLGPAEAREVVAPNVLPEAPVALQRRLHGRDLRRARLREIEHIEDAVAHRLWVVVVRRLRSAGGGHAREPRLERRRQGGSRRSRPALLRRLQREKRGDDMLAVEADRAVARALDRAEAAVLADAQPDALRVGRAAAPLDHAPLGVPRKRAHPSLAGVGEAARGRRLAEEALKRADRQRHRAPDPMGMSVKT